MVWPIIIATAAAAAQTATSAYQQHQQAKAAKEQQTQGMFGGPRIRPGPSAEGVPSAPGAMVPQTGPPTAVGSEMRTSPDPFQTQATNQQSLAQRSAVTQGSQGGGWEQQLYDLIAKRGR